MEEVYVVSRLWYDFEDNDCNGYEVECICKHFYTAIKEVIGLCIDELDVDMVFDKQFEIEDFTLENIKNILKKYNFINLIQKVGDGKTQISISKRPVI